MQKKKEKSKSKDQKDLINLGKESDKNDQNPVSVFSSLVSQGDLPLLDLKTLEIFGID
jgi:hypothetical protein